MTTLTPDEREKLGKAARDRVPPESHATFRRLPGRKGPVALLEGQPASRLPDLVPVRYGRLLVSPFTDA